MIVDGTPAPTDILNILGIEALAEYMVREVQKVYRLQGVLIDDKHIECITRQMLQKVEVIESGDSDCLLYTSPSPRDQRGSRMPSSA